MMTDGIGLRDVTLIEEIRVSLFLSITKTDENGFYYNSNKNIQNSNMFT